MIYYKPCHYCNGTGKRLEGPCWDCHGIGVVCNLCGRIANECECPSEPPRCDECGKQKVACKCDKK